MLSRLLSGYHDDPLNVSFTSESAHNQQNQKYKNSPYDRTLSDGSNIPDGRTLPDDRTKPDDMTHHLISMWGILLDRINIKDGLLDYMFQRQLLVHDQLIQLKVRKNVWLQ